MRVQSRQSRCLAGSRRWLGIERGVLRLIRLRPRLLQPMGSRVRFEVVPYRILVSSSILIWMRKDILNSSSLDGIGAKASLANKLLRGLVVDRGQS